MKAFSWREHAPSILVVTLSSAFGACLLQLTGALATVIAGEEPGTSRGTVALVLGVIAIVFIVISVYVGAVVTTNTFATIVAGRVRSIALLRLLGASARDQRRAVVREGLAVGAVGTVLGFGVATATSAIVLSAGVRGGILPDVAYDFAEPVLALPLLGVFVTTWLASLAGSVGVLRVSPMQAIGAAQEPGLEVIGARRGRNAAAVVLFAVGTLLLAAGVALGLITPAGVLVGLVGGVLSFTGVVLGAGIVMPPALRLVGRLLGRGPAARLAAENAVRYPARAARATIGLVIAVALVTMFAVAAEGYARMMRLTGDASPALQDEIEQTVTVTVGVFSALMGFSAVIAAIGMATTLSLGILQRTRELGLLRALGFSVGQLRAMIGAESAQQAVAAVLVGLALGIGYGWAGAQSVLGSMPGVHGILPPVVPGWLLGAVAGVVVVVSVAASVVPARRATRLSPVAALAAE